MAILISLSGIRKNLVASFAGKVWAGVMSLVFIPLYIRFLGIEAYGLIGIYISMLALLAVLDMGLSTTLNRELARLSAMEGTEQESRDLVRTLEVVYWWAGIVIGTGIAAMAPLIARHWVHPQGIPPATIERAVMLMGLVAAFEWPAALYTGGLMGTQRQVLLNGIRGGMATVQAGGAVLVLWLVSPTILAYFTWQILVSLTQSILLARALRTSLPRAGGSASFRKSLLRKNWGFAAGMTGISVAVTVLTQLDKVILSNFLSLEMFGYYVLAFNVASALGYLVHPVFSALFPRFAQIVVEKNGEELSSLYHKGCRLLSVLVLPAAICLAFFSREILSLWIGDPVTVQNTYALLSLIVIGTALNALMTLPYTLQLAYGWTRLSYYKNLIAIVFFVPCLIWMIRLHGAKGGAIAWIALNAGYFLIEIPVMHRRLLQGEMWRWYLNDVGTPAAIVLSITVISRLFMPAGMPAYDVFGWISLTAFSTFVLSALALKGFRGKRCGGSPA